MKLSKLVLLCSAAAMISISPLASAQKPAAPTKLDINNPDDVAKMDRKMQSSLKDGEEIVYYWEGNVYTRIAGEKDRQLFTYYGMNIRTSKGFQDPVKGYGWRHVSREVLFYLDPVTKQVVRTWKNPWTGEELDVQHVANDPVNGRGISYHVADRRAR